MAGTVVVGARRVRAERRRFTAVLGLAGAAGALRLAPVTRDVPEEVLLRNCRVETAALRRRGMATVTGSDDAVAAHAGAFS